MHLQPYQPVRRRIALARIEAVRRRRPPYGHGPTASTWASNQDPTAASSAALEPRCLETHRSYEKGRLR